MTRCCVGQIQQLGVGFSHVTTPVCTRMPKGSSPDMVPHFLIFRSLRIGSLCAHDQFIDPGAMEQSEKHDNNTSVIQTFL